MKAFVIALWISCIAAFFLPESSSLALPGQRLFWGVLIVHAIECVAFLPRLRRAGGSLASHLAQTLVFGMVHALKVGREAESPRLG